MGINKVSPRVRGPLRVFGESDGVLVLDAFTGLVQVSVYIGVCFKPRLFIGGSIGPLVRLITGLQCYFGWGCVGYFECVEEVCYFGAQHVFGLATGEDPVGGEHGAGVGGVGRLGLVGGRGADLLEIVRLARSARLTEYESNSYCQRCERSGKS